MRFVIGIDPGNQGAIALLCDFEIESVADMPLLKHGKKQQVNAAGVAQIIRDLIGESTDVDVAVERVSAMPGNGSASMFNFGMGYGVVQGVVATLGLRMHLVTPQAWKRAAGLIGKEKDMSRTFAQQLYPSAPLARKKDVGRADAILIARYLRMSLGKAQ